jgi:uncharacterized protein YrrD
MTPADVLVAPSKVKGKAVYDMSGARLGSIEDIMIDKPAGRLATRFCRLALGADTTRCRGATWTTMRDGIVILRRQRGYPQIRVARP